ncbi:SDR family oxidoreductase [Caballeronia sp. GAWG2-1]|uniref:SDR family oxidoreductase n=1 Tax=Caballeronia sp. GAWG2-1 TaxID=2921744 RepID=UPI0020296FB8|nr:SDR family oxidoreductase [Caballeronia sp. GAWG2-1]
MQTETKSQSVFRDGIFKDKVILVSGGGTGLGKAAAEQFARLGASLVICGRDPERMEVAKSELEGLGAKVLTRSMTIRDPDAVASLMDEAWNEFGRIDILVNNAGGQFASPAIDIKPKGWLAVVDTNLNGTWYMMQAAAQRWKQHSQPGNIINVVAVIWRGLPQVSHTCAARAGVVYLSKSVAVEWAEYGIRVNCLAPGTIETDAFNYYNEQGRASFWQANPMKHAGEIPDISEGITYLASDASKFITGEVLTIDGGQQLWGDPWFAGRPKYYELDYEVSRRVE